MALELHIAGPGLETRRLVQPGEAELVLGRDIACDINLPDPERNVSRRHLAVRNVGDKLQYRVLSQVNGIDIPQGYVPPGGQGLLAPGQPLKIGDYVLHVLQIVVKDHEQDPWAVFDNNDYTGSDATLPRSSMSAPAAVADFSQSAILPEEDPFGDWGFESAFGPAAEGLVPGAAAPGGGAQGSDLSPFFKGLGLDKANLPPLSPIELEAAGRAVRVGLEGLCRVYAARAGKPEVRKPGVGVVPVKDNNPLKTDWPEDTKLQYLLGGRAASIGFVSPERALGDIVAELLAHDSAVAASIRVAVEATLQEFSPAALQERLLGSGHTLFEGAQAWEAYSRHYSDKSQDIAQWVQQLLDQYFNEAYLREIQRIKRETGPAPD